MNAFNLPKTLEAISRSCPNLRELIVMSTLISDLGIRKLCGVDDPDGLRFCQQLRRLIVTETRVTWVGALCALENFPRLVEFDFDKIFQVIENTDWITK